MVDRSRALRGWPVAATAAADVVLGHWLAYLAAVPEAPERNRLLLASGHGYWFAAVWIALVLALSGAATVALRHVRTGGAEAGRTPRQLSRLALRLFAAQAVAFTGMEVVERLTAGAPLAGMFGHHLFVLGLAVQLIVAGAGAVGLVWFSRLTARVIRSITASRWVPARRAPFRLGRAVLVPLGAPKGAWSVRGPPSRP